MIWMAWITPTAIFFATIAALLLGLVILELLRPTEKRRGFLNLNTTRGDRVFISLLSSAFIHLFAVAVFPTSIWLGSLAASLGYTCTNEGIVTGREMENVLREASHAN